MDAWVWFLIAAVAGIAGVALLLLDRAGSGSRNRERRRWAGLRGWQFADADTVLADRWRHGALAGADGGGTARNLVTGSLFTAAGRRLVHVFDHGHGAGTGGAGVIAAVHRRTPQPVVLELWLPTVRFSAEGGLDLLGPVGDRYAFTSDLTKARPLITPELVELTDDLGDDVPVAWIEDAWVVASVSAGAGPSRLERLLRMLGELADLVDGVHTDDAARPGGGPVVRGRTGEDGSEDGPEGAPGDGSEGGRGGGPEQDPDGPYDQDAGRPGAATGSSEGSRKGAAWEGSRTAARDRPGDPPAERPS